MKAKSVDSISTDLDDVCGECIILSRFVILHVYPQLGGFSANGGLIHRLSFLIWHMTFCFGTASFHGSHRCQKKVKMRRVKRRA